MSVVHHYVSVLVNIAKSNYVRDETFFNIVKNYINTPLIVVTEDMIKLR